MLTVTKEAVARLAQMLNQQGLPEETAVRFVFEGDGLVLRQDSEREGDAMFQHEGRTVLLLDAQVSARLAEHTLDLQYFIWHADDTGDLMLDRVTRAADRGVLHRRRHGPRHAQGRAQARRLGTE